MFRIILAAASLIVGSEIYENTEIYPDQVSGGSGVSTGLDSYQVCTQTADDTTPGIGTGFGPLSMGCNIILTSDSNTGATAVTTFDGVPPTTPGTPGTIFYVIGAATAANPTTITDGGNFELEGDWSAPLTGSETRVLVLECLAADTFVEVGRHNGARYYDNDIQTGDGDIFAELGVALDLYSSATATTASTNNVNVSTGNATNAGDYNSGAVAIFTGTSTTLGDSGGVSTYSGNAADTSGSISVYSGTSAGAGENSGSINIYSGNQTSATGSNSGVISVRSGSAAGTSNSGSMSFFTGTQTNVGDYQSGPINIYTGTSSTLGDTGFVAIRSGNAADTSGDIEIYSGTSANTGESSGGVSIYSGNQTHATGGASGGFSIHSGDASGTGLSGGISMYTGSQSNVGDVDSGDILVYTGATTTDGDSGDITYQTGAAGAGASDAGDIVFQTHGANTRLTVSGDGTAVVFGTAADLDGNTLYYDLTNDADTYDQWVSADKTRTVTGGLQYDTTENSYLHNELTPFSSDTATQPIIIRGQSGYAEATGSNRDGGAIYLVPGSGSQNFTVLDYNNCAGDLMAIHDGVTNNAVTEGAEWTAATSNEVTATSLASAIDALSTFRATASGAVVHVYGEGIGTYASVSTGDGTCASILNDTTKGVVQLGRATTLDFSSNGTEYILATGGVFYFRQGNASSMDITASDVNFAKEIDVADGKSVFVGGTTSFGGNNGWNQAGFGTGTADGYHLVVGLYDANVKNYDHGANTNVALFLHSNTDPDSDNTQWGGLYHNATDFIIETGAGDVDIQENVVLDNTGTDVNSPYLYFRGDSTAAGGAGEVEGAIRLAYGAQPYLIFSVDDDHATPALTDVAHIDDNSWRPASAGGIAIGSSTNYFSDIYTGGHKIVVPATQELSAAETLTVSSAEMTLYSDGGAVVSTADPALTNGAADGEIVCVMGTSDANTIQWQDETDNAGSTLELSGNVAFTMGLGDRLCLRWYASGSKWFETSRSDN